MSVKVKFFATLRTGRGLYKDIDFYDDIVCQDILDMFDISVCDVAILYVNGIHSKPQTEVSGGDVISIFPPVRGG